jgi:8-oxo-dGTP diphosphatase
VYDSRYYIPHVSRFSAGENLQDSDSREYPARPILGVGGVVIHDGRVLLARRGTPPLLHQWSIPGGKVEAGETLQQAVRREMAEETGLDVRVRDMIEVIERIDLDAEGKARHHYVIIDYLCEKISGDARAASDVAEVAWAAREELERFSLTEAATRVIHRAFEMASSRS